MASLILPAAVRRQVMAFYTFARTADDIADDPALPADIKLAKLDALEAALAGHGDAPGTDSALALHEAVNGDGLLLGHAAQLLQAFRRDALVNHCRDWGDLMNYCRFSAAPVGRFLLQLHGEAADTAAPADALCAALQVLNHLQDCGDDLGALGRVYIPRDWLRMAGLPHDALADDHTGPEPAPCLRHHPGSCGRPDRHGQPPARPDPRPAPARAGGHHPGGGGKAVRAAAPERPAGGQGQAIAARLPRRRACRIMARIARMSGRSSFYWAMRLLPRPRREAMFALYGYCRMLDDIADGPGSVEERRARLAVVRGAVAALFETGVALEPTLATLAPAIRLYDLPRAELEALIDGMESDVNGPLTAPRLTELRLYCRRVAGSVGLLAVRIFGRPEAGDLAVTLGEALQLTNILRDVAEDARLGRLYLPAEALHAAGMVVHTPQAVLPHPALPAACAMVAELAQEDFQRAEAELARLGRARLFPAMVMMATYRRLLSRLIQDRWRRPEQPPRLGPLARLWIALRVAAAGS
ncbi:MAG: squalene/phytoene synthase family protein [Magnetospirillum sp.]|nr:squalene/phytoene synthase family protein [Magnetospirillum sp.]